MAGHSKLPKYEPTDGDSTYGWYPRSLQALHRAERFALWAEEAGSSGDDMGAQASAATASAWAAIAAVCLQNEVE